MVRVAQTRIALPLADVIEVLPAMAHTPLPGAPPLVRGVVNVRGEALGLLDLRIRLGSPARTAHPDDLVVVCNVGGRRVGIWLDAVEGLETLADEELVDLDRVAAADHVSGVALLPDDTVLVCDLRSFLSADEALRLDRAVEAAAGVGAL
jgi:purine-binding chemotaxis protein CheW